MNIATHEQENVMAKTKIDAPENCFHCGELCQDETIEHDHHSFCCQGCKMVYQVLSGAGLHDYYEIEEKPGQRMAGTQSAQRFAYLDDPDIQRQLLDFSDGNMAKITFHVPQIHCTSCIWLLEKLHQLEAGIYSSRVNFLKKEVYLTFDPTQLSLKEIVQTLSRIGYEPTISFDSLHKAQKQTPASRKFAYKLGVTGFCLGNIMLVSFPEYLGINQTDQSFIDLFGYLNLVLSVPVFFYGASGYLRSAYEAIRHRGVNIDVPISLGLVVLFLRSIFEVVTQTGAGYFDSMASLVFLLLVGKWFQEKTFENISFERDYKSYFPIAVTVLEQEKEVSKPLSKVKTGDRLLLRSGELIPADAVLIEGEARIDYSFVTGEAAEIKKEKGDQLFAGGRQKAGIIVIELIKEVSQSYLTRLWNEDEKPSSQKHRLNNITDRLSQVFTYAIIVIATLGGTYWYLTNGISSAMQVFTSVLIIACPCALALTVPFTLGNAIRLLARSSVFAKSTEVLERMTQLSHLVFDKTGTITSAQSQLAQWVGEPLTSVEKQLIASLLRQSTHPVSQKALKCLQANFNNKNEVSNYHEETGQGIYGMVGETSIRVGKYSFVNTGNHQQQEALQPDFMTSAHVNINGRYRGHFIMKQSLRTGMEPLFSSLRNQFDLSLLSGDNEGERKVIENLFGQKERLYFQQSPADKKAYIAQLQQNGKRVLMMGDGLNDAGALMQSDVAIAVAENVHQFSPACDVVMGAHQVASLNNVLVYANNSLMVVKGGFMLSILYNIVGVTLALNGMISPVIAAILMPLSSVTVVTFGVVATWWLYRKHFVQVTL